VPADAGPVVQLIGGTSTESISDEIGVGYRGAGLPPGYVAGDDHRRVLKIAEIVDDDLAMRPHNCHNALSQAFQEV
jgi:hypothetical protein